MLVERGGYRNLRHAARKSDRDNRERERESKERLCFSFAFEGMLKGCCKVTSLLCAEEHHTCFVWHSLSVSPLLRRFLCGCGVRGGRCKRQRTQGALCRERGAETKEVSSG